MAPLHETARSFPTAHLSSTPKVLSWIIPVNGPRVSGGAGVTGHEQGGAYGKWVEGARLRRWTGYTGQMSVLEKGSGITHQEEASCFQGPRKQLKCTERLEESHGEW